MSEKDVTSIEYLKDNEHFADLINTYYFHGEQIVLPSDIYEQSRSDALPPIHNQKQKSIVISRDIVRKVDIQITATIIALEEQSDIHYAMPVRVMAGDSANYHNQWRELEKTHKAAHDLKGDEFLSDFSKKDHLMPVCTLVLYFGRKPWDGPRCLKDMLDLQSLPQSMQDIIADYPIQILEVRKFADYELFQTDLKLVFGFLQRDRNKKALQDYIENNKLLFENLPLNTYNMIK